MEYIELHSRSAFSFLRGASTPEKLAERAAQLQMPAIALCDRDGLYGAPRLFNEAKELGVRALVGAELTMEDNVILPVLVRSRRGYENLSQLLTRAHLRNEKSKCSIYWNELSEFTEGLVGLANNTLLAPLSKSVGTDKWMSNLLGAFGSSNLFVEIQRHRIRGEEKNVRALVDLATRYRLPLLATNGVQYATEAQRQILDLFTCIRHHTSLDAAGKLLEQNGERYLKTAEQMCKLFHDLPEAIANTVRLADRLDFSLNNLGYEFPAFPVPESEGTMDDYLLKQAFAGARAFYGDIPAKINKQLKDELDLIKKLKVAGYFLIVWDMIQFCRQQNIMAQGRGSAANSTVCFCLGITMVDPNKYNTLFERFLTEGRKHSWPDIDIDLPSGERREKVIQEIYKRYGARGAAMTANVITYRGRSAAREVGKALGLSGDVLSRFSNLYANGDFPETLELAEQIEKSGLPKSHPRTNVFVTLCNAIKGLPRHLGQHSGGMIICEGRLDKIMPLENASMPNRVVGQWDKEDCENLGIIKVDFLGLGMMSVLQDAVELVHQTDDEFDLKKLEQDDSKTFEMMRRADTIGLFQIESRAQMATLPRLKPEVFYDLVIEVAIVRPGPIQGNLMHPYLKRRQELQSGADRNKMPCYHESLRPVLDRTLGIPLFQEQMLKMAMVMADFSGARAEELRSALSFHRSGKKMSRVMKELQTAMASKGHPQELIDEISATVSSFALYGFPESHAISFAHLVYLSAYLKAHKAPEFYASILNNQPMGFYSSATLVKDGQRHGVKFLSVCALKSDISCTVESDRSVRLGLCVVKTLSNAGAKLLVNERNKSPFTSLDDFKRRLRLSKDELRTLAEIGALNCFVAHRRDALWAVEKELRQDDLFDSLPQPSEESKSPLSPMNYTERIQADFAGMHLTIGKHPMALIRSRLKGILRAADLPDASHGSIVRIAGNVICRQRPGTAKGVVFVSLEDETGVSNAVVYSQLFEDNRLVITEEPFLMIEGQLQHVDNVIHIKAQRIQRLEHDSLLGSKSYDFH